MLSKIPSITKRASLVIALSICAALPAHADADLSGLRSILDSTSEGGWTKVNLNNFVDAWLPFDQRAKLGFSANTDAVIGAWSSVAWDGKRGDLILYGGGHFNYAGNEVYRWSGVTKQWTLASLPSQVVGLPIAGQTHYLPIDGALNAPQSAHTYDNTLYLPVLDRYVTFGGASTNSGGAYVKQTGPSSVMGTGPYFWDPAKADPTKVGGTTGSGVNSSAIGGEMWNNRDYLVNSNLAGQAVQPRNFVQGTTAYRTENGKDVVYVTASNGSSSTHNLWKVTFNDVNNPSADVWQMVGQGWAGGYELGAGTLDAESNVFVRIGDTSSLTIWDLDKAGVSNKSMSIAAIDEQGHALSVLGAGLEYDPLRDRILLWNGGGDVWYLDLPDRLADGTLVTTGWVFKKDSAGLLTVPGTVATGINGKWDYIAGLDAYVGVVNSINGEVWLYKPTDWMPAAVPEPDVYAMMLVGFGLVFYALRRRERRRQPAAWRLEMTGCAGR